MEESRPHQVKQVAPGVTEPVSEPAPPDPVAKKSSAREKIHHTALDRGWLVDERTPPEQDIYYKSNPVLGGYEKLRVTFTDAGALKTLVHENLNKVVPVPERDQLDHALNILTGE